MTKGPFSLGWSLRWPNKTEKAMLSVQGGLVPLFMRVSWPALKISRRHIFSLMGYGLYVIGLLVFFLYLTFPYQKLQDRLIAFLEQASSCQIRVNESRWLFPVGLFWKGVHFSLQEGFTEELVVDQARAKVYLLPLLRRSVQTDFSMEVGGGKVRGSFSIEKRDGKLHYYFQESAQDVDLQRLSLDIPVKLEGHLRLDLEAAWQDQALIRGSGSGTVELLNVKTSAGSVNGWQIPDLAFGRIALKLGLKDGMLALDEFDAQGPHVEATGNGTMLLRNRWSEGLLNVNAKAYFKEDLRQKFPVLAMLGNGRDPVEVAVKGNLGHPLVSINGMPLNL